MKRRWLIVALWVVVAALALDVLLAMALGPTPLALGALTLPARRLQLEVALAAGLAAAGLLGAGALGRPRQLPAVVALLTLGVLHANTRAMGSADTTATASVPFMLVREGTLAFDKATWIHQRDAELGPYYLQWTPGRVLATYPVTTGVLATPFYLPAVLGRFDPAAGALADLEKLAAAGLTALGAALLFVAMRRWVRERVALLAIAAWVMGTAVSPVLGQGLWQHTGAAFALCGALWALCLAPEQRGRALALGLFAGLAAACRPLDLVLATAVVAMLAKEGWRRLAAAAAGAAVPLALVAAYNQWAFGKPWATGYGAIASEGFGGDWLEGMAGLLFSPARGLFVLSPLLLAAVVPLARRAPALAVAVVVYTAIIARWTWWHGGYAPGQRYLADVLPFLGVGLAYGFSQVLDSPSRGRRWLLALVVTWSVIVNALLTYVVPPPATRALVWNLVEGPFTARAFPPVAYAIGWTARPVDRPPASTP